MSSAIRPSWDRLPTYSRNRSRNRLPDTDANTQRRELVRHASTAHTAASSTAWRPTLVRAEIWPRATPAAGDSNSAIRMPTTGRSGGGIG